ncbi:MAG TPA: LacI family DNA-binding transcriptional regulator [Terriglobales bacterium]|nr:LacI family DNA-binding transcriptional regulator [Terriglobales bacterium]
MPNMHQIAARAKVSLGTVSHVLNDSAKVREPLRKRVLDAVAALGYQPSELARGLRRKKTSMIGMIIPDVTNPFFPAVVRGAEDVAFANGYRLVLCDTDNDPAKETVFLNELRGYRPAGLIVIPSSFGDLAAQVDGYRKAGTAIICVDRTPRRWDGDSVTVANEAGAYAATRHLIELGHTRIATIAGPLRLINAKQRLSGYKRAMRDAGLIESHGYIQEATFDKAGGYAKANVLLHLVPRPTAIFAANDMIALGVLQALRGAGLQCPGDMSLIGFDDLELAEMIDPQLSSVSQPGYRLGASAASLLLERVNNPSGRAQRVVLETELKIRASVAAISNGVKPSFAKQNRVRNSAITAR